jgi:membrane-anchored mycosin MYCP
MPGRGLIGVAPGTRVLPIRVTAGQETVDAGALANGIRAAVDGGVRVVAVALSTANDSSALRAAVAYAGAHDVLVVAADPAGSSSGGTAFPAALPGVVAVASIEDGDTATGGIPAAPPTLAAPGTNLVSVAPRGDGNVTASGNGIAVGFVAGAAALVRDYRPGLSAEQVRHRLMATADHPTGRLPDRLLGYGVVDPVAAVVTALPEESGESGPHRPAPPPIHVVLPPPPDRRPADAALVASAAVLGCAGLAGLTIAVVRRGRRPGASDPA